MSVWREHAYLVVMAGGSGTRFWPRSTSQKPKQFLSLGAKDSLLTQTLSRFSSLIPLQRQMILTTQALAKQVQEHAPGVKILAEPQGRNTAPCLYWAAQELYQSDSEALMLVMPSDHTLRDLEVFLKTIEEASAHAWMGEDLVTLGVKPTRPETGYGYLKLGAKKGDALSVEAFIEKPDLNRAQRFVSTGEYLWNGGMFIWKVKTLLQAFDEWMPEMRRAWEKNSGNIVNAYPEMTATSIDFGVMEKAKNVVTFVLDCGWDDLGSWLSIETLAERLNLKFEGNTVLAGEVLALKSSGNIVDVPGKTVALLDISETVIVETSEVLLVAPKAKSQDVKLLVEEAKKKKPTIV